MLMNNNSYHNFIRLYGAREASLRNIYTNRILVNSYFGSKISFPQGYNKQTAIIMPRKTGGNIAATLRGEGLTSQTITAIGNMNSILAGEGTITPNANMALNLNAELQGEGNLTPGLTAIGSMTAELDAGAQPSAFDIAQETLGSIIESGVNLKDVLKILTAVAVGKTVINDLGGGNAEVIFRDVNDTTDRITASMTGSERTDITLDTN